VDVKLVLVGHAIHAFFGVLMDFFVLPLLHLVPHFLWKAWSKVEKLPDQGALQKLIGIQS
jgi:hypothetical protein